MYQQSITNNSVTEKIYEKNTYKINEEKVCAFTGYRPQKLDYDESDSRCTALKKALRNEINSAVKNGFYIFISGMALGVDMWAAEEVLSLKKENKKICLYAAVPFPGQSERWQPCDRERYEYILSRCDKIYIIEKSFKRDCMYKRNKFMVENSDMLIAVYDGQRGGTANTISLAGKNGIPIRVIDPNVGNPNSGGNITLINL